MDRMEKPKGITMDISEKPEVTVSQLVEKLQGSTVTDRMARPEVATMDLAVNPEATVMDRMARPEVATMDLALHPEPIVTDRMATPQVSTMELAVDPEPTVMDRMAIPEVSTLELAVDPEPTVMDKMATPVVSTMDLPANPELTVMDRMAIPQVSTMDLPANPEPTVMNRMTIPQVSTMDLPMNPEPTVMDRMAKPQVIVHQGMLEGITLKTNTGFSYNAFLGIPYAKPPVGNLRFKDPQPSDHWDGVRDAKVEGNMSPQIETKRNTFQGKEDCLYLNVYAPQGVFIDSGLPVMFWIHGGGYKFGSGGREMFGPDFLVDKDVILVTINYRLGPLGFLCLHTAEVSGNAGLKDQIMALKWVNENIRQFGGNSKNITIFGESAGAASAHGLVMSPMAKGLFGKAIFQSGTSISEWCSQSDPVGTAVKLAQSLGFKNTNNKNSNDLLRFLTNVQYEALIKASNAPEFNVGNEIAFSPVIEKPFPPKKAFLTENPINLLRAGKYNKVPTMSGVTSNEGVVFFMKIASLDLDKLTLDQLIPSFQEFIPKDMKTRLNAATRYVAANRIKDFYFANEDYLLEKFFNLMTDFAFVKDTELSVKSFSKFVPSTYYFRFSYKGSLSTMSQLLNIPYSGVAHGDDLRYVFKPSAEEMQQVATVEDTAVIKRVTEMWTNFAKSGNPTPKLSENIKTLWKPVTAKEFYCYDISEECSLIQNPFQERAKFWEDLSNLK